MAIPRGQLLRRALLAALATAATGTEQAAADGNVRVAGGADTSGRIYIWTLTNHHASPLVYVEFPHFRAGLFHTPPGWTQACTGMARVGAREVPGLCSARADTFANGVQTGATAEFRMQLAAAGAQRQRGSVTVGFADGATEVLGGVELPGMEAASDRFVPLIGLGSIFLVILIVRGLRRSSGPKAPLAPPGGA